MNRVKTLGELKAAIRKAKTVWVWTNWEGEDGAHIPVPKAAFLRGIGADTPNDGAHGGRHDHTPVKAWVGDDGDVFIG